MFVDLIPKKTDIQKMILNMIIDNTKVIKFLLSKFYHIDLRHKTDMKLPIRNRQNFSRVI